MEKESNYEKIRNLLSPIGFLMDTMKYGTGTMEKDSLLRTAYNSMERIKSLLDEMEREEKWGNE